MRLFKKGIIYAIILLFPSIIFAQKVALDGKEGTVFISGKIGKLNSPQQLWIYMGNEKWDSIPVKDGKFEYRKTTILPAYGAIMIKYKPYYKGVKGHKNFFGDMDLQSIFFEAGEMFVQYKTDSVKKAVFSGRGAELQNLHRDIYRKEGLLVGKQRKIAADFNAAPPEKLQSASFMTDYERKMLQVDKQMDSLLESQIVAHPNSLVSTIAFDRYLRMNENKLDTAKAFYLLAHFSKSYQDGVFGKQSIERIRNVGKPKEEIKITAEGDLAPSFSQTSVSGSPIALKDFQGKYVLIDFWASWCLPCRKVNPELVRIFKVFKKENFTILGVSLDEDKSKWQKAIADDKLDWPHVSDLKGWKNEAARLYGIQGIPQNVLVDPTGKIVVKNLSTSQLEAKLKELFKKI